MGRKILKEGGKIRTAGAPAAAPEPLLPVVYVLIHYKGGAKEILNFLVVLLNIKTSSK